MAMVRWQRLGPGRYFARLGNGRTVEVNRERVIGDFVIWDAVLSLGRAHNDIQLPTGRTYRSLEDAKRAVQAYVDGRPLNWETAFVEGHKLTMLLPVRGGGRERRRAVRYHTHRSHPYSHPAGRRHRKR
jgi:hypothetical protein